MRINYHLGPNMRHALRFAHRAGGLHTFAKDRPTEQAIKRLESLGLVEVNQYHQFCITWKGALVRAQMDAE